MLKLHAGAPDLALEDAVLEHLREEPAVPRLAGAAARANGYTVRLLSWLEGEPWALAPRRPRVAGRDGGAGGPRAARTSRTRRCTARTGGI